MSKENLKTVELGYGERLVLRRLLQQERGDEVTGDVVDWFIRSLGLTEEEAEDCQDKEILLEMSPRPFTFSRWREKVIVKLLKATAAARNLGQEQITLYHKFVPPARPTVDDEELAQEYAAMLAAKQDAPVVSVPSLSLVENENRNSNQNHVEEAAAIPTA